MRLETGFDNGWSVESLADWHERTKAAIVSQLEKMYRLVRIGRGYRRVERKQWVSYADLIEVPGRPLPKCIPRTDGHGGAT